MSETIDGLKQRLVGAFVILSLAVIFLPMIFDKPHAVKNVPLELVPPKPVFQKIIIEKPKRPQFKVVNIDPKDQKIKVVEKILPQKQKLAKKTKPTVSHLPIFKNIWMVQLGTFSNVKNAYALRDTLRKDGFDGHAKDIKIKGKKAVRVFSGPFVNKREAVKLKKKLDKKYKVDSLIIYFDA